MTKLKCWKKIGKTGILGNVNYKRRGKNEYIMTELLRDGNYEVLNKKFKNVKKAKSYAIKYMKKHDKC
jgi:hypothetical protein